MTTYEHGVLWTKLKATCLNCDCEFIYMPKDLQEYIEYNFTTMEGKAYKYISCPECGAHYIYTDPTSQRYYNDSLIGTPEQPTENTSNTENDGEEIDNP